MGRQFEIYLYSEKYEEPIFLFGTTRRAFEQALTDFFNRIEPDSGTALTGLRWEKLTEAIEELDEKLEVYDAVIEYRKHNRSLSDEDFYNRYPHEAALRDEYITWSIRHLNKDENGQYIDDLKLLTDS